MTTVYLVLKHSDSPEYHIEIQGVFSTEKLAIAACKTEQNTYTPLILDEEFPQEPVDTGTTYNPIQGYVKRPGADWEPIV